MNQEKHALQSDKVDGLADLIEALSFFNSVVPNNAKDIEKMVNNIKTTFKKLENQVNQSSELKK